MKQALYVLSTLYLFNSYNAAPVEFVDGFFDEADIACGVELNIAPEVYQSWFDEYMQVTDPNNQVVQNFLNCWMLKRGMIDSTGELHDDFLKNWLKNDVYTFVGKGDLDQYPLDGRVPVVETVLGDCKSKYGVTSNLGEHALHVYNCVVGKINE